MLKDAAAVYEHHDRTNTETSIHVTFSISKPVTGLLCGILMEHGKLDPSDVISPYIPEVEGSAYESVSY